MNQNLAPSFSFVTTGLGTKNTLQVIGLGREDHLPYLISQDSAGDWHDSGRLLKDYLTPWSMLAIGSGLSNDPLVFGLGLDDGLPYLISQDSKGAWHDNGRLVKGSTRRWSTLVTGKGSSNLPQVIGLGRKDGLLYLIGQDKMGTWHNEGLLLKDYARPWSTLAIGKSSSNALQVIGLGRNDGLPYVISQDSAGGWHDAGRLGKTNNTPWSTLVTGTSSSNALQVIGLGRSDGLPYWFRQDDKGSWIDAGRLLKSDNRPWAALTAGRGAANLPQVIGLGRDDRLPYAISQDEKGSWNAASLRQLKFYDLTFETLAAGAGSALALQLVGTGHDDGLPYRIWQDQAGWHFGGLLPLGEKKLERALQPGEALVFSENNYQGRQRLIAGDVSNIERCFPVASIQLGPRTGVTLFSEKNYAGISQELSSELASLSLSRLQKQKPQALKIWPSAGKPFTGSWAIRITQVTGDPYLSVQADANGVGVLTTRPQVAERESFRVNVSGSVGVDRKAVGFQVRGAPFSKPAARPGQPLTIDDLTALTMVDEAETGFRCFSLLTQDGQWICYQADQNHFRTSAEAEERAIFCQAVKLAEDETQVGELEQGEVALFENPGYWGKAWVFSTDYPDFGRVVNLDNDVSSIQLGPLSGATIYREAQYTAQDQKLGKQDVTTNLASLAEEQVGDNQISSIELWRVVQPAGAGISIQCLLSQDFRGSNQPLKDPGGAVGKAENGSFEEYSAYRTTIRFPYAVETVDVWATDETQIEVDNQTYSVGEDHSKTLHPNPMHCLVITTDACVSTDGQAPRASLRAPGLKIRANTMRPHERIIIYPDQEVHRQLANLKGDDLWNAKVKDKDGHEQDLFAKKDELQKSNITQAQNMIATTMSTVKYDSVASGGWSQKVSPTDDLQNKGWMLDFPSYRVTADNVRVRSGPGTTFDQIGLLRRNEVVRVLQFNGDHGWLRIARADGQTGWSSVRYLDQVGTSPQPPVSAPARGMAEAQPPEVPPLVQEKEMMFRQISQAEVQALHAQAITRDIEIAQGWFLDDIVNAVKEAVSVVVAQVEKGVELIVQVAGQVIRWVADTAQKVVAFVEGVFEKIGLAINEVINWLRYVFDWQDILDTKKYLHDLIQNKTDSVCKALVKQAEGKVKRFFECSKSQIEDALNRTIRELGGDPRQSAETPNFISQIISGFESSGIPDAMDWIMAKLMSAGSMGSGFAFEIVGSGQPPSAFDKDLRKFYTDTVVQGLGNIAAMPGELGEVITTLARNPDKPLLAVAKLIEMIRDQVIGLVNAGEQIVEGLFHFASNLIDKVLTMLDAAIRIPILSDIFEWLGVSVEKVSLLDVICLIVAIPITALSKALFHELPFCDARSAGQDYHPLQAGYWLFLASCVTGAFGSGFGTILDCKVEKKVEKIAVETEDYIIVDQEAAPEPTNTWDAVFERLSLGCSWVSFITGLFADQTPYTDVELNEPDGNLPDCVLPLYDLAFLLLDTVLLSMGSNKKMGARLRRYDDHLAYVATAAGIIHIILYLWDDWGHLDVYTFADAATVLPDATAFLKPLSASPILIGGIGLVAFIAGGFQPITKGIEIVNYNPGQPGLAGANIG